MSETQGNTGRKQLPILEHSESRIGQTWTIDDHRLLALTLRKVDRLASDLVARLNHRIEELESVCERREQ